MSLLSPLREGWIKAVTMSHPESHRQDILLRLRELQADQVTLKG